MEEHTIFDAIKRNVLTILPEIDANEISMDSVLSELGCNSIDRAEVLTMTMDELHLTIPVYEFHRGENIRALVGLMRRYA